MRQTGSTAELLTQQFDANLPYQLDSWPLLEAGMANLDAQGIAYGNTESSTTLIGGGRPTLDQQHQLFFHDAFVTCVRHALGLAARIDTVKYLNSAIEPALAAQFEESTRIVRRGGKQRQAHTGQLRASEDMESGIRTGIQSLIVQVPDAVNRIQTIGEPASTVSGSVKAEISGDAAKQYAILKLLTSDIGSTAVRGFQDPGLALATFLGIADYDPKTKTTAIQSELTALLHDKQFDPFIAAELLESAFENSLDGDRLTPEELEFVHMIAYSQFYSGDDRQAIIARFATRDGINIWPQKCGYSLMSQREWFAKSLAANGQRVQSLIYENILGGLPADKDAFTAKIKDLVKFSFQVTSISGNDLTRANRMRTEAAEVESRKRASLLARLVGGQALNGAAVELVPNIRPVSFVRQNGGSHYQLDNEPGSMFKNYLASYNNEPALEADLLSSIDFLRQLTPQELGRMLSQSRGLRKWSGHQVRIGNDRYSVCRMRPRRIAGLHLQSPSSEDMRVFFVQLRGGGGIGILGVERVDREDRTLSDRWR